MIAALMLFAQPAASAEPEVVSVRRPVMGARLEIPDEIAPAVVPYMLCKLSSAGVNIGPPERREAPTVAVGTDCAPARAKAVANADTLLKRSGSMTKDQRRDLVERTLQSIETFHMPGSEAERAASEIDAQD